MLTLPAASASPPVCSSAGGVDVDGPIAPEAFFLGGMLTTSLKKQQARAYQIRFARPRSPYLARQRCRGTKPRSPMGPASRPLYGSAGGEDRTKSRSGERRGRAHGDFTQVRAARMRKTLLLPCLIIWMFLSPSFRSARGEQCVRGAAAHAEWAENVLQSPSSECLSLCSSCIGPP